jgi:hypothetical protein
MRADEIKPRKLVIFDIDDTLVHTQTTVQVINKDGQATKELNSHEFTHYKLQPGEKFDFENFRNAHDFFHNSKPIIPMMNQLKQDIATGNQVVMVTARADFDDRELFLDTFRKYGVDMSKVHVYRAGNMNNKIQTEEKKKIIIRNLLSKGRYTKAIMYDDAEPNLQSFVELKAEYPKTKFYAWHVSLEGEANEYDRTDEDQALEERRKKKRRSRNAAYGPGLFGGYGYYAGYSGDSSGDGGGGGDGGGESIREDTDKKEAILRVQKMLNDKYDANLDLDGILGPLTRKSINKFMPNAKIGLADDPNKTTAVQGKKIKENFADGKNPQDKGDFNLMGQNLFLKNLAHNIKQRYPDATVKLSNDRVTAHHNDQDDEALNVMGTEVMDGGYIGVGLDDAFTESFQRVLVPTIKQTTEQLLAANPGMQPALFLGTDNWNPDAWAHIAAKLGYRLVAGDEELDENFADGKNPQDKGDAKRHGVNTKASVSSLRKTAKQGGRKGQLAHWMANMKAGRAKNK